MNHEDKIHRNTAFQEAPGNFSNFVTSLIDAPKVSDFVAGWRTTQQSILKKLIEADETIEGLLPIVDTCLSDLTPIKSNDECADIIHMKELCGRLQFENEKLLSENDILYTQGLELNNQVNASNDRCSNLVIQKKSMEQEISDLKRQNAKLHNAIESMEKSSAEILEKQKIDFNEKLRLASLKSAKDGGAKMEELQTKLNESLERISYLENELRRASIAAAECGNQTSVKFPELPKLGLQGASEPIEAKQRSIIDELNSTIADMKQQFTDQEKSFNERLDIMKKTLNKVIIEKDQKIELLHQKSNVYNDSAEKEYKNETFRAPMHSNSIGHQVLEQSSSNVDFGVEHANDVEGLRSDVLRLSRQLESSMAMNQYLSNIINTLKEEKKGG